MIENERAAIAEALCGVIAAALPAADRSVKWSAPSFALAGRDIITLNLAPRHPVRVVFHRGAKAVDSKTGRPLVADDSGRLVWASDQRAYAGFADLAEVVAHHAWLAGFCRAWAAAVPGSFLE